MGVNLLELPLSVEVKSESLVTEVNGLLSRETKPLWWLVDMKSQEGCRQFSETLSLRATLIMNSPSINMLRELREIRDLL
jgi:hypothetical protein